ncbi:iron dependent repressor, metal binding and dimerization domain protein [Clostridium carnis]
MDKNFYTFNGYIRNSENVLTASMEDYIEMIYRLAKDKGFTRVNDLSQALNVQPPSTTKMIKKLSELKLATYERYGVIILTDKGNKLGSFLLDRHNTIEKFLSILGVENTLLEETEKIEHVINDETLKCIKNFLILVYNNNNIKDEIDINNKK